MRKSLRTLMYQFWARPILPLYFAEATDNPPALPEGFDIAALQGDAWQGIIQGNEAFKENAVALNTKGPMDAIEQLVNANKLLGKNRLPSPQEDWKEEDWNNFYKQLGRPESVDGYKYENVPEIEGFEVNDEFMKSANEALFNAGLTPKQHSAVMDTFFGWLKTASEGAIASTVVTKEQSEEALKKEFGENYEPNVQAANNVIAQLGDAETSKYLADSGLGNHPGFIKMMFKISELFKDDESIGEAINSNLSGENQAIKKIAELKGDENFQKKLFNESNPGHREAVAMWHDLHKKAYPGVQTR